MKKKIYVNKVVDFSFTPSLLKESEAKLSDNFISEFNSVREKYLNFQKELERIYHENLNPEVNCSC